MNDWKINSGTSMNEEKSKVVSFRLSPFEYRLLQKNAEKEGLKISEFAKMVLLQNMNIELGMFEKGDIFSATDKQGSTDIHIVVFPEYEMSGAELVNRLKGKKARK